MTPTTKRLAASQQIAGAVEAALAGLRSARTEYATTSGQAQIAARMGLDAAEARFVAACASVKQQHGVA